MGREKTLDFGHNAGQVTIGLGVG